MLLSKIVSDKEFFNHDDSKCNDSNEDVVSDLDINFNRLVKIGVLKKVNRPEWAVPAFIILKKDGTVRFISDF